MALLLLLARLLCAHSENNEVLIDSTTYPVTYSIDIVDEMSILYETPLFKRFPISNFNLVAINGVVNDPNIACELWIPYEDNNHDIVYTKINGAIKVYPNGRFWCKFEIDKLINAFKIVFLNNKVKVKKFYLTIYEIEVLKVSKKKVSNEEIIENQLNENNLSLEEPLPFKLIRRSEWKANPPKEQYIKHTPMMITIHHTAGHYPQNLNDAISEVQFIQDYHQNVKGWIDISYHFLISPTGDIFEGRPIYAVGAHVAGKNVNNIGISIMGNYHDPVNNEITEKTISALIMLVGYIKDKYKIQKTSFYAHRELSATDCPGDVVYAKMDFFKEQIFGNNTQPSEISISVDTGNPQMDEKILKGLSSW